MEGIRFAASAVLACIVTFGLFFCMQFLVSMGAHEAKIGAGGTRIEFVRLKRSSAIQERKRELPEKEKPPEPPPPPQLNMATPDAPDSDAMAIAGGDLDLGVNLEGGINLGTAPSDADTVPLVRVPPIYPVRASERGIEGWVVVRFTISATGTVKNPVVVDAKPARIFDRAAIRAIKKWKYKPKIEDGEAVERPGIEVKLTFDLDDAA